MRHLVVRTSHGPLYLTGTIHTDQRRPCLFVMGGMGPIDDLYRAASWFPGANVLIAPLPGMGGSMSRDRDVRTFAKSIDELLPALLPDRPVVMLGVSAGCLATLGARSPQIVGHVAVEPFFRTAPLWPFHEVVRKNHAEGVRDADGEAMVEALFGYTADRVIDRDYRWLLKGLETPLDVVVGVEPLEPPRKCAALPSFTSAEDRALLAGRPSVTFHEGQPGSGHDLLHTPGGAALVRSVLHKALVAAAQA